jgi:hypothetical protein
MGKMYAPLRHNLGSFCSVEENLQITASRGVRLVADKPIAECSDETFNLIVLPVSDNHNT